jgi:hypothetical protein
MGVLDDILPPDRSDAAPITTHLRGLLEQLHNGQGERPRITITLEQDAWAMLESQFRRPYKPHSSYLYLPLDVGTVAFERKRSAEPECPPESSGPRCMGAPLATPITIPCEPMPWDASAIEAKAAALAPRDALVIADEALSRAPRSEGAIYTAPMTGAEATYGGPWKGDGK